MHEPPLCSAGMEAQISSTEFKRMCDTTLCLYIDVPCLLFLKLNMDCVLGSQVSQDISVDCWVQGYPQHCEPILLELIYRRREARGNQRVPWQIPPSQL
jgi:hypothetical protein